MAKKQKEEPKVDNEVGSLKVKEQTESQPEKNETKGDVTKVQEKMKMKPIDIDKETITKVDLNKSSEKEDKEKIEEINQDQTSEEPKKDIIENEETPILEEINEETVEKEVEQLEETITEAVAEAESTGKEIPEGIQKLMNFMDETGGDLEDYIKLNQDYSKMDNHTLLKEYYKQTKPHLDSEEIDFMMDDYFAYDEDVDEERDVKRKKLALKEQVAQARQHLDGAKSKYYEDVKTNSKLTSEQQKAIDFFNRYSKESKEQQETAEKQHRTFLNKTDQLFNKEFKGFEYNIGEKKFRFNVKNAGDVKETQSDINNFVKKFLNKNNEMEDTKGYHKSMFTAMNPDAIANHFYEQGKADALKQSIAKSKNINMDPRQQYSGEINTSGVKVKVLGDNSNDFKFKIKNNN